MLTASTFHGINAALNFVMRTELEFDAGVRGKAFGGKSVLVYAPAPPSLSCKGGGNGSFSARAASHIRIIQ